MATKDYDPKKVTIALGAHVAEGFSDGTFISVSRNSQTWTVTSGASGEHARSKSNDRTATVELTLMQTSKTNDFLSAQMLLDEGPTNAGKFTFGMIDANGTTVLATVEMWVQQPPTVENAKELSDRTWTLECGDMEFFVGGTD